MSISKRYHSGFLPFLAWMSFLVLLVLGVFPLSPLLTVQAQSADLISDVIGYPTSAQVGEEFTFFIRYRCASTTNNCEDIEIEAQLPDYLDIISVDPGSDKVEVGSIVDTPLDDPDPIGSPIIITLVTSSSGNPLLCDNSANDVCYTAGETSIATIVARIHPEAYDPDTTPQFIDLAIESTANVTNGSNTDTTIVTPGTEIEESNPYYTITKTRTAPGTDTVAPVPGQEVTYALTVTPTQNVDNVALADFTIIDTLPSQANYVTSDPLATSTVGNVITWSNLSNSFNGTQLESVTVTVTVTYPADAGLIDGTTPVDDNVADYTLLTFNDGRVCTGTCTGSDTLTPQFDAPASTVGVEKSIVGNPVGIDGTGRFNLAIDNVESNYDITLETYTDVLPITGGNRPLEIEEISVGSRDVLLYTSDDVTCDETTPTANFTLLGNYTAGTTIPITTPNDIVCVRWDWDVDGLASDDDVTLASGERIDAMQIVFTPRISVAQEGQSYQNCVTSEYIGPGPAATVNDPDLQSLSGSACADVNVAGSNTNINLQPSKDAPGRVEPTEEGTFSLNFTATERSAAGTTIDGGTLIEALPASFDPTTVSVTLSDPDDNLTAAQEAFILNTQTLTLGEVVPGDADPRNVFRWSLPDGLTADPIVGGIPPALVIPLTGDLSFSLNVTATLREYTEAGSYENLAFFLLDNGDDDLICESGNTITDTTNLDGDGNTTENLCQIIEGYDVPATAILRGQKWIRNETIWDNTADKTAVPAPIDVINNPSQTCDDGWLVSQNTADGLDDDTEPPDNIFSRFPCAVEGIPGDSFTYSLTVQNVGNTNLIDYTLIDILPYNLDTEVLPQANGLFRPRSSEWRPRIVNVMLSTINGAPGPARDSDADGLALTGDPINNPADVTVEYSDSNNPCRFDVTTGCNAAPGWSPTPNANTSSFRITANSGQVLRPGDLIEFTVEMVIPTDETNLADAPFAGEIIWNSYAHSGSSDTATTPELIAAEPIKVGIRIPETVSVGNFVWIDSNNNQIFDPAAGNNPNEALRSGVTLTLYEDTTGDGTPDSPVQNNGVDYTVTTDASGYYIFNMEQPGQDYSADYPAYVTNRNYMVVVDATNFQAGGALEDYINSTGTGSGDTEDKGVDTFIAGVGYASAPFTFAPNSQPTGELASTADEGTPTNSVTQTTGAASDADFGPFGFGALAQDDDNSNLRIDFGFYQPMSLGNRVWLDIGEDADNDGLPDSPGATGEDDGIENVTPDETDNGVANVTLELYTDSNNDNIPDGATPIATTVTDADGYYLFDNLAEGLYVVVIPPSAFDDPTDPLFGYDDSTPDNAADNNIDRDDNGVLPDNQATVGERSETIVLINSDEPTTATTPAEVDQIIPAGITRDPNIPPPPDGDPTFGRFGELDVNSNLTLDFGFQQDALPDMELGNFVWDDVNNNSQFDTGEAGIANVRVNLYADSNGDGTLDATERSTIVDFTDTQADGYYVFTGLQPGLYIVELAPQNWSGGGALENYISSSRNETIDGPRAGETAPFTYPAEWDDQFDDGLNETTYANYAANGIRSDVVRLLRESEAPGTDPSPAPNTDPDPTDGDTTEPHFQARTSSKDTDSDLTVDFGVYVPLSLGNRVWRDNYGDGSGTKVPGDGIFDTAFEQGINGVTVRLFRLDDGGDPNVLNDYTQIATDNTANGGYYLFDGLTAGIYRVYVPRFEFNGGTLNNHISSDGVVATDGNINNENLDHGVDDDDRAPELNDGLNDGIWSLPIELSRTGNTGDEATGETDNNTGVDGVNGWGDLVNTDGQNDNTVDLGFYVPPHSIGNLVWFDTNANGVFDDATEIGIEGVTVELYDSANALLATTITDVNGYYLFDNLPPGDYYVQIPATEFDSADDGDGIGTTGELLNLISTHDGPRNDNGAANVDNDDNGGDSSNNAEEPGSTEAVPTAVRSELITLSRDDETVADTNKGPDGDGRYGEDDDESDLTIDFGFFQPVAVGNVIWRDEGAGANFNNGLYDTDESGIAGVTLTLYVDTDNDGVSDGLFDADPTTAGIQPYTDTTDVNGYYIFDGLPPGDYLVGVDASNFDPAGALEDYVSSNGIVADPDSDSDNDDNSRDTIDPTLGVLLSDVPHNVTLTVGGEPITEDNADKGSEGDGRNRETDNSSNLTVDGGFYRALSIGNRVWLDTNANGIHDTASESGIQNVTVALYDATDTLIDSVVTDADGYYRFDRLRPGDYYVQIPAAEFDSGALTGLVSTLTTETNPNDNGDENDNGIDDPDPVNNGIRTNLMNLSYGGEPTGEDEPASYGAGARSNPQDTADDFANMTLDLGFVQPVAVGNRVWEDLNGNGSRDIGEPGIDNVSVELYDSGGTLIASAVTASGGYYRFDNLVPGDYYVEIPALEFTGGDLVNYLPVVGNPDADADPSDIDDNGDDVITDGVRSLDFTLEPVSNEPVTDTDVPVGAYGAGSETPGAAPIEPDNRENLTVDFGFFQPVALGNVVWDDVNNDGEFNAGETGLDNVTINLFRSTDVVIGNADDVFLDSVDTASGGFYRFDNLTPGNYYVRIPAAEFSGAGDLVGFRSSTGAAEDPTNADNNEDQDDNSGNRADVADLQANGLVTALLTLQPGTEAEPTGEIEPVGGYGTGASPDLPPEETDIRENLTLDIGVYRRVAVGNFIWQDSNNNGLFDTGETPLANITVQLYDSAGTLQDAIDTDGNGYYIFDNLPPGNYYIQVPAIEFISSGDLIGYQSSDGNGGAVDTADDDVNENGQDGSDPTTDGVRTDTFTLGYGNQPINESGQRTADYNGLWSDADVDLTRDLSFVQPVSIGNQVWYDTNNDGTNNNGEVGIAGVTVELYDEADTLLATTTTNTDGFYLFTRDSSGNLLLPARYYVQIPADQFAAGGALNGYYSSGVVLNAGGTLVETPAPSADLDIDNDDNGDTQISGVVRSSVLEVATNEPLNETPRESDPNPDNQSNLTVDFGFYTTVLGNRVFIDANNDGLYNVADSDTDVPDGTLVALLDSSGNPLDLNNDAVNDTAITSGGLYTFTGLPQGDYQVWLAASNFDDTTDALFGHYSSTGGGQEADPDTRGDENDNGLDNTDPAAAGILTATFSQEPNGTLLTIDNASGTTINNTVDLGVLAFDLALNKVRLTAPATLITPGDSVTFTITVFNQSDLDAFDVAVIDYIPTGMSYADSTVPAGVIADGSGGFTIDSIAANASVSFDIELTVDANFTGDTLINYAEITRASVSDGGSDASDIDSTPDNINQNNDGENADLVNDEVNEDGKNGGDEDDHDLETVSVDRFDLALRKVEASTGSYITGEQVEYTLQVFNQGNVTAYDIDVTDYIPSGMTFDAGSNTGWIDNNDGTVTATIDQLAAGSDTSLTLWLDIDINFVGGDIVNYAEISDATNVDDSPPTIADEDSTPDNINQNGDGETTNLVDDEINQDGNNGGDEDDHDPETITANRFDLALTKVESSTPSAGGYTPGDAVIFTITVINQGSVDAFDVQVTDYIPTGMSFASVSGATDLGGGVFEIDSVTASNSVSFDVTLTVDQDFGGGDLRNWAEISFATDTDGGVNNVPDTDSTADNDQFTGNGETDDLDDDNVIDEDARNNANSDQDEDDHDPAEITANRFDLALTKVLDTALPIEPGGNVAFTIEVFNQGNVTAYDIEVTDYVPVDMIFNAGDNTATTWTVSGSNVTTVIDEIAAGSSVSVTLVLQVDAGFSSGEIINYAEISDATNVNDSPPTLSDEDSTPDNINQNGDGETTNLVDDEINQDGNNGGDEDDHDLALVAITLYDLGDLPDSGSGVAAGNYETLRANGGPIHAIDADLLMGAAWDNDLDGQPDVNADGDDTNGDTPDDEDGVTFNTPIMAGQDTTVDVIVTNNTGADATLYGFIDWNGDGDFDDAGESVTQIVNDGTTGATATLTFSVPENAAGDGIGARFRLGDASDLGANGDSPSIGIPTGEVEDYLLNGIVRYDYGDLPDDDSGAGNTYPTNITDGGEGVGASHEIIDGYFMGTLVDAENDGQPNATADGDDSTDTFGVDDGQDDEDGVVFPAVITAGTSIDITVTVSDPDGAGNGNINYVVGFIDWNADNDFADANERVQAFVTGSGVVTLTYDVPTDAAISGIGARFRLSENNALAATGAASEGEVEDYLLNIGEVYRAGNLLWIDENNNGTAESGEPGISGVTVELYNASDNGLVATTTTDADGKYSFDGLLAGDYFILVPDGQTALENLLSGETNVVADPDTDIDNDNNGDTVQTVNGQTGQTSGVFTLGAESEPTNEQLRTDDSTDDDNTPDVRDNRSNYTIDLAYIYEYRIGNLVWDDLDRDAVVDSGEPGISGVTVTLYDSSDTLIDSTITDGDGFYSFDGLRPDDYYVAIEYEQAPIRGYTSSPGGTDPDDDIDNDDNGVTDITTPFDGVRSDLVTLGPDDDEPINEVNVNNGNADDDNDGYPDDQSHYALDFGFYLTYDWGDNPDNYNTTVGNNGPRHPLQTPLLLGLIVDDELDGQPNAAADGDDITDTDDEDGVNIPTLAAGQTTIIDIEVNNNSGQTAFVQAWIDFNGDGDFDDAGERIAINENLGAASGTINLSVAVPVDAVTGVTTYARFRISTSNTLGNGGEAPNGEVEDYSVIIQDAQPIYDYGDAPDDGTDDNGTDDYDTINESGNPARHQLGTGLRLGNSVDDELNGQPNAAADGDDNNNDDEDSITVPPLVAGQSVDLDIEVNNPTSDNAFLQMFIDWNGDGDFNDVGEQIGTDESVPANSSTPVTLTANVPADAITGDTYARLRLSTQQGLGADGDAPDGEVEDYLVTISGMAYDWGDAPDDDTALYPTNSNDNGEGVGPSHLLGSGLLLGAIVDAEADGQPVANDDPAIADDDNDTLGVADGQDDEDGVTLPSLVAGQVATVSVVVDNPTSNIAYLQGWIDWNDDGDWNDVDEQIASNVAVPANTADTLTLIVNVPASAVTGSTTYARFRISTRNGLGATGAANNGEVEDYELIVQESATLFDFGDAPDDDSGTSYATNDTDGGEGFGPRHQLGMGLVLGNIVDDDDGTLQNVAADADDTDKTDDEDSVTIPTLVAGSTVTVSVTVNNPLTNNNAYVQGWIDWNGNGSFDDAGEQIATNVQVPAGSNTPLSLTFDVPSDAVTGDTYARFRISTEQDLPSTDAVPAADGEVEDHLVTIGAVEYDYGDNPDSDDGSDYPTNDTDGGEGLGARHQLGTDLRFGNLVDADPDGQPNATAEGDDTDGNDDEDGVTFPTLVEGQTATISVEVNNPTRDTAYVQAWIDWNDDGDFDDAGEQIATSETVASGTSSTLSLSVEVPTTADGLVTGIALHTRFRISTVQDLPVTGDAPNGEIEDHIVPVEASGTQVYDYGDNPDSYATNDNDDGGEGAGARHLLGTGLIMGDSVDDEIDGQPATTGDPATRDDLNGSNDEDGVTLPVFIAGSPVSINIDVDNPTADDAYVQGWIDWNGDGDFDDINEQVTTNLLVPAGSTLPVTINTVVPTLADGVVTDIRTYARFRISTEQDLVSNGEALDGEVEDYDLIINTPNFDRGDAPDSYGTDKTDDGGEGIGPAHVVIDGLRLGVEIDDEDDGVPTVNADGDNTTGIDDEDGVDHPTFTAGGTVLVAVEAVNNTGSEAFIQGWIDWNGDGDFNDADEYVAQDVSVPDGTNGQINIDVVVPDTVTDGNTYARWRLSTDNLDVPTGVASNGEIEDYVVVTAEQGISVVKDDGKNAIVAGTSTTYTVTITNTDPADTDLNNVRTFIDNVPISNPNGYNPDTVSWICTATGDASCENPDSDTAGGNAWEINESIVIPFGETITFEITATLYPDHQPGEIINVALIEEDDVRDDDVNNIIYDPPTGTKVGTFINDNVIEWRMNWINGASLVQQDVEIIDPIGNEQTYVAGSLNCERNSNEVGVVTTIDTCEYDPVQDRIIYRGTMGPDGLGEEVPDDSLNIIFRVTVPGAGEYQNTATLTVVGGDNDGEEITSTDTVSLEGDGDDGDDTEGPVLEDPTLVKFGDPAFARPGEEITWVIRVTNPNENDALAAVSFTDNLPDMLDILNVIVPNGVSFNRDGNALAFTIQRIEAGETISIEILTRLPDTLDDSSVINSVSFDPPYDGTADAIVTVVAELPATGESPWWQRWIVGGGLLLVLGGAVGVFMTRRRWPA